MCNDLSFSESSNGEKKGYNLASQDLKWYNLYTNIV